MQSKTLDSIPDAYETKPRALNVSPKDHKNSKNNESKPWVKSKRIKVFFENFLLLEKWEILIYKYNFKNQNINIIRWIIIKFLVILGDNYYNKEYLSLKAAKNQPQVTQ